MRIILIGDPHGCLDELKTLIKEVKITNKDRLIFLGDLVDRGPDSLGTIRYVRDILKAECVLGNHEEKWIRFHGHELKKLKNPTYRNPMKFSDEKRAELSQLEQTDWEWLGKLPTFIRFRMGFKDFIATHAGVPTDQPIEKQYYKTLVRVRYVNSSGSFVSSPRGIDPPEGSVPWHEMWDKYGTETVIFGHNVVKEPLYTKKTIGIDTGCVFGGKLTALIIENMGQAVSHHVIQTPAKKIYWELPSHDSVYHRLFK